MHVEIVQDETVQDETVQDETAQDETVQDEMAKAYAHNGGIAAAMDGARKASSPSAWFRCLSSD